jgi:hypothetical protein
LLTLATTLSVSNGSKILSKILPSNSAGALSFEVVIVLFLLVTVVLGLLLSNGSSSIDDTLFAGGEVVSLISGIGRDTFPMPRQNIARLHPGRRGVG